MIPTLKFVVLVVMVSPAQRGQMGMRRNFVVVGLPAVLLVRLAVISQKACVVLKDFVTITVVPAVHVNVLILVQHGFVLGLILHVVVTVFVQKVLSVVMITAVHHLRGEIVIILIVFLSARPIVYLVVQAVVLGILHVAEESDAVDSI